VIERLEDLVKVGLHDKTPLKYRAFTQKFSYLNLLGLDVLEVVFRAAKSVR